MDLVRLSRVVFPPARDDEPVLGVWRERRVVRRPGIAVHEASDRRRALPHDCAGQRLTLAVGSGDSAQKRPGDQHGITRHSSVVTSIR